MGYVGKLCNKEFVVSLQQHLNQKLLWGSWFLSLGEQWAELSEWWVWRGGGYFSAPFPILMETLW